MKLLAVLLLVLGCTNPVAPDCRPVEFLHVRGYDPIFEEGPDGTLVLVGFGRVENVLVAEDGAQCRVAPGVSFRFGAPWCCKGGWE